MEMSSTKLKLKKVYNQPPSSYPVCPRHTYSHTLRFLCLIKNTCYSGYPLCITLSRLNFCNPSAYPHVHTVDYDFVNRISRCVWRRSVAGRSGKKRKPNDLRRVILFVQSERKLGRSFRLRLWKFSCQGRQRQRRRWFTNTEDSTTRLEFLAPHPAPTTSHWSGLLLCW